VKPYPCGNGAVLLVDENGKHALACSYWMLG